MARQLLISLSAWSAITIAPRRGTVSGVGDSTASCSAVLRGPGDDDCTPTSRSCNPATGVITDNCNNRTTCPSGCSTVTNQCIVTPCPVGYVLEGNQCVFKGCPTGYLWNPQVKQCERIECPAGFTLVGNQCKRFCPNGLDKSTYPSCTCPSGQTQAGALCIEVPLPITITGHLKAIPALVRQGETSRIYWSVTNAQNCTVNGTNTDVWNTLTSGSSGKTTSAITARTVYTLMCNAFPGATPATVKETAVVNIVPSFQEL